MFKTFMGPVEEDASVVYLRPETAQGTYVNFLNVQQTSRKRVPFGVAQLGKAFRNEITPGNFIFRTREFEQAEMQFFVKPGSDDEWFDYWKDQRLAWHHEIGIRPEKLRLAEHGPNELAHYAKAALDIEYEFPFGWQELEGVHNRTDFDLSRHQEYSGKRLRYIDPSSGERYIPYVVETAMGVGRAVLAVLADAYREEEVGGQKRVVLSLNPRLAPVKAAVFPLVKKDGMPETARRAARRAAPGQDPLVLRFGRIRREALPPAGRSRDPLVHHHRRPDAGRPHRHDPRPRQRWSRRGSGWIMWKGGFGSGCGRSSHR